MPLVGRARAWVRTVVRGPTTLASLWDDLADLYGDRVFVEADGAGQERLTYRTARDRVAALAGVLAGLGVRPGERVCLCSENRVDYALSLFAVARLGAVAVPLHHRLRPHEAAARVVQSTARFVLADPEVVAEVRRAAAQAKVVSVEPGGELTALLRSATPAAAATVDPAETVAILYTSGTTGTPKGARLTSTSLLAVPRLFQLLPNPFEARGVYALPTAHIMGLTTVLSCAFAGVTVLWRTKFDAAGVLDLIEREHPTFFVGVPAMYGMLLRAGADKRDLTSVKLWIAGADAMPPEWAQVFRDLGTGVTGVTGRRLVSSAFLELYGMVELSGAALVKMLPGRALPGVLDDDLRARARRRFADLTGRFLSRVGLERLWPSDGDAFGPPLSYALPIPPYKVKICDDAGAELPLGEVGELWVTGPGVTRGYDGEGDGAGTSGGWLPTGDLAKRGRLGEIVLVGRKKDVLMHGGYSVFPAQVEEELRKHPEVSEAVVFGAPHPTKGEIPVAVVVPRDGANLTAEALHAWCKDQIAGYSSPRAIGLAKPEELPRNANQKVVKADLKAAWLDRLRAGFPAAFE